MAKVMVCTEAFRRCCGPEGGQIIPSHWTAYNIYGLIKEAADKFA